MRSTRTPLGRSIASGAVAGAVGTIAMDAIWYVRHRRGGGDTPSLAWEFGGVHGWSDVSAPGQVGKRALDAVFDHEPPDRWAQATQNVVHWATGVGWGMAFGLVAGRLKRSPLGPARLLGPAAWGASYAVLPKLGVYKPMRDYDTATLARDLSAHEAYGLATGAAFAVLTRRVGRRAAR